MHLNYLLSVFVIVTTCLVLENAGTQAPSTESVQAVGEIDPFKNPKKKCTQHNQCSCTGGIAICYDGYCGCIYSHYICSVDINCAKLCDSGVGICVDNTCKCYKLVEDVRQSESISPWSFEEVQ